MRTIPFALMAMAALLGLGGCVTVKPQQPRDAGGPLDVLFDDDVRGPASQMQHALDNREGGVRRQRRGRRRVRLQLRTRALLVVRLAIGMIAAAASARAQVVTVDTAHTLYTEAPTGSFHA